MWPLGCSWPTRNDGQRPLPLILQVGLSPSYHCVFLLPCLILGIRQGSPEKQNQWEGGMDDR